MDDTAARVKRGTDDAYGRATDVASGGAGAAGDVDERTREIRGEIEETRVEMSETIDAIQEKLKPRNIVASATDRVKSAATERVRDMAETASHTAQQAMDYTRDTTAGVTNTLRQNPMPLALIGAGAAWLWARSRGSSHGRFRRDYQRDYGRDYGAGTTRDEEIYGYGGQADEGDFGMMATIRNNPIPAAMAAVGLSWLAFSRGDSNDRAYGARWGDWSSESASTGRSGTATGDGGIAQNLTESASQMAARTRAMARRRQSQFQRMVEENPLLVGAGALMLGAAFGMAVPETETENELMGSTRDSMVERARAMARDAANQVQDAAGTIADAAGKIAGGEQG